MSRKIRKPSAAFVLAFLALLVALGGNSGAIPGARSSASARPNIKGVKASLTVSNGEVATVEAKCPAGYEVFSGGYIGTGQHTVITAAAPARGDHAYIVTAVEPPVNFNSAVLKETATVQTLALCAPVGKPMVLGHH